MLLNLILDWPVFSSFPVSSVPIQSVAISQSPSALFLPWHIKSSSQSYWGLDFVWVVVVVVLFCFFWGFFFCYLKLRSKLRTSQRADSVSAYEQRSWHLSGCASPEQMCFCLEDFLWAAPKGAEQCSTPSSKIASKQEQSSDAYTHTKMGADETNGRAQDWGRKAKWQSQEMDWK